MESIILSSFLKNKGDNQNRIILTNDKLVIIYKRKIQEFYKSNILRLSIDKKKLIIPLLIGGIGTSLSMIAMSMGWYDRQINLFIIIIFFGIMYYGFVGKNALEVLEKGKLNIYLLNNNYESVKQFIQFFNARKSIDFVHSNKKIYHITTNISWKNQMYEMEFSNESLTREGFIHASTVEHLVDTYKVYYSEGEELVLITIVPERLEHELKYELVESRNACFPHVFGKINKTAIQAVHSFSTKEELDLLINFKIVVNPDF